MDVRESWICILDICSTDLQKGLFSNSKFVPSLTLCQSLFTVQFLLLNWNSDNPFLAEGRRISLKKKKKEQAKQQQNDHSFMTKISYL